MAHALAQLEEDGRITAEERKARVRQYLAKLDQQEERQVHKGRQQGLAEGHEKGLAEGHEKGLAEGHEKGLAEGHEKGLAEGHEKGREALLRVAAALAPDAVSTLASITDLADLEKAVQRIILETNGAQ